MNQPQAHPAIFDGGLSGSSRPPLLIVPGNLPVALGALAWSIRMGLLVFATAVFCWHASAITMFVPASPVAGGREALQLVGAILAGVVGGAAVGVSLNRTSNELAGYLRPALAIGFAAVVTFAITYFASH